MSVDIEIDLKSGPAHGKIQSLRADLETLSDDLDLDFGVDDDLKKSIQEITDKLGEIKVDVDYEDLEKAAALKAMLEGDIDADLNVNTDEALKKIREDLDPPDGGGGIDHDEQARKFGDIGDDGPRFERFTSRMENIVGQPRQSDGTFGSNLNYKRFLQGQKNGGFSGIDVDLGELKTNVQERVSIAGNLKERLGEQGYGKVGDPFGLEDYDSDRMNRMKGRLRDWSDRGTYDISSNFSPGQIPDFDKRKGLNARRRGTLIGGFKQKLKSLIPSMNTFYTIFAAVLPLMLVMGTQLLGVAAAMGSVAVAGGSILALGLVGHGENMASSWRKAKEQLSTLKQELFETFQPTMQTFAPIQSRFFETAPEKLDKVATSMEGLTAFSDTIFKSFAGLTDFIAEFFDVMVSNEGIISQLTMRFGEIIGNGILDFFKFLVVEAYNSQEMLITLGSAFADLLSGAYQFSKIIARIVMAFRPLAGLFAWLGKFLNNKLVVGILTFVATLGLTIWAVTTLTGVMTFLVSIWAGGLIATIISSTKLLAGYIFRTLAAVTANYALAASIANVVAFATMGIGALLGMAAAASAVNGMNARMGVDTSGLGGGGMPSRGGGYGGGSGSGTTQNIINHGDTYNMEVNGDVDNATEQGMRDIATKERSVNTTRQTPNPGGA